MSSNEFTRENRKLGLPPQLVLDAGLNVFALDLIVESFTQIAGKDATPVEFTYKGVNLKFQINEDAA